jgi:hypothetical protein
VKNLKRPISIIIHQLYLKQFIALGLVIALTLLLMSILQGCARIGFGSRSSSMTIAAVGDTNGYNSLLDPKEDPLREVKSLLKDNDIFIFNYEGVILSNEPTPGTCHRFPRQSLFYTVSPIANFLRSADHTIATLANNHVLDCGSYGIRETIRKLESSRIQPVGAGNNSYEACEPILLHIKRYKIALVAYLANKTDTFSANVNRAGSASWDECNGKGQIEKLKAEGYIVVASLHLHLARGWTESSPQIHVDLVKRVLDAGADVVIAHGPHVPQGILQTNGRLAMLSIGNFLFHPDYKMPRKAHRSFLAKVTISPDGLTLKLVPLILDDSGSPRIPSPDEASAILSNIVRLSAELGTEVIVRENAGYVKVKREW